MRGSGQKKGRRDVRAGRPESGVVFIIGDGLTERRYFERLSRLCEMANIRPIAIEANGPEKIIKRTESMLAHYSVSPRNGDLVAIVMDLDERYSRDEIMRMDAECAKRGYRLFISNPSFEVWLLCHFRLPTHQYDQHDILTDLERELRGPYKKSSGFDIDDQMVERAVNNASRLLPLDNCNTGECYDRNPSTMVHSLVDSIRRMMRRR